MNVVYLHPVFAERAGLGQLARRAGLQQGLLENGVAVRPWAVGRRRLRLPELLSCRAIRWRDLPRLDDGPLVVVVEGLPAAVALLLWPGRRPPSHVHVDVCDSWRALADIAARPTRGRRWLKRLLAITALRAVGARANSVSYISHQDLDRDAAYLPAGRARVVVAQTRQTTGRRVHTAADGPFVVVGDWAYPPNQEMLRDTLRWLGTDPGARRPLRVVGPGLGEPPSQKGVTYVGWVDDIVQAYQGTSCALALISSGAGVKNKVLEPLALGVPVVATASALSGIDVDGRAVLEVDDAASPAQVEQWLRQVDRSAPTPLPPWRSTVQPLVELLRAKAGVPQ